MQQNHYVTYTRRHAILKSWERNQAAIADALKKYHAARRLEVATLKDGTKIVVRREDYGGFSIAGVLS